MKNAIYLLSLLLILTTISCSSDIGITSEVETEEETPKTGSVLEIVSTSLSQINDQLQSIDIRPFSTDELDSKRTARESNTCLNAQFKGDINTDQIISSDDVLDIFKIIKEYDDQDSYPETANGDGKLNVNKEYVGSNPTFWSVAHVGKLVTFDEGGSDDTVLDRYDAAVLIDLITQKCN